MHTLIIVFIIFFNSFVESINNTCSGDDDCLSDKSVCINNVCKCDALFGYSTSQKKCLKYAMEFGALCFDDLQCQEFFGTNGVCTNNQCVCNAEYRWYKGKCTRYARKGEPCNEDLLCLDQNDFLSLTCEQNVCQCSNEYYDRGEDCRVKSQINKECAINEDCFPTDFVGIHITSHCELGKCVGDSSERSFFKNAVGDTTADTTTTTTTTTTIDTTTTIVTTTAKPTCIQGVLSTLTKDECAECANTQYFREAACICNPGFFLHDGQCVAELGMLDQNAAYIDDKNCPIKPGHLENGICYCRNYWFPYYTNRECKKTTLQYTSSCMDNDWCRAMGPYAYCNSETKTCECINQAQLNETSFYCDLVGKIPDCLVDLDCPIYQVCLDQKCQCIDGFFHVQEGSDCLPKIGSSCEIFDCSHINNAACDDSVCVCNGDDFVTNEVQCLLEVTALGEECLIDEQCEKLDHAACLTSPTNNETSLCSCTEGYFEYTGVCYFRREYGWPCSTHFDCTVNLGDSVACRNNICQCPVYYSYEDGECKPNSALRSQIVNILVVILLVLIKMQF